MTQRELSGHETNFGRLVDLGHPLDLVIRSFKLAFSGGGDHPMAQVGIDVTRNLGGFQPIFADDNGDDDYDWLLRFAGMKGPEALGSR